MGAGKVEKLETLKGDAMREKLKLSGNMIRIRIENDRCEMCGKHVDNGLTLCKGCKDEVNGNDWHGGKK
jgi:hypothetical protein